MDQYNLDDIYNLSVQLALQGGLNFLSVRLDYLSLYSIETVKFSFFFFYSTSM